MCETITTSTATAAATPFTGQARGNLIFCNCEASCYPPTLSPTLGNILPRGYSNTGETLDNIYSRGYNLCYFTVVST